MMFKPVQRDAPAKSPMAGAEMMLRSMGLGNYIDAARAAAQSPTFVRLAQEGQIEALMSKLLAAGELTDEIASLRKEVTYLAGEIHYLAGRIGPVAGISNADPGSADGGLVGIDAGERPSSVDGPANARRPRHSRVAHGAVDDDCSAAGGAGDGVGTIEGD